MSSTPSEDSAGLRSLALANTAESIGMEDALGGSRVFGVLMETAYATGVVTLVCFADGTTSIYFSNGGGVIGCGAHAAVAAAAKAFVALADHFVESLPSVTDFPPPPLGSTRFYLRTAQGTLAFEAPEADLGNNRLPQSTLFHAGHAVISGIRELNLI